MILGLKNKFFDNNSSFESLEEKINSLNNLINSKNDEIEKLNNRLNKLENDLSNDLNMINQEINTNRHILENSKINNELNYLKKENNNLKEFNKETSEILDSYNENFKLLFYHYDLKPKNLFKNLQAVCQEVLNFVANVCDKYNIEYWIDWGTLLGAVRHDGFLPWDDDIDLGMMRKDFERFIEVFDSELKNHNLVGHLKWRLLRHGNNILYFIQISYAGFATVDIFPCDFIENPPENIEDLYVEERSKFRSNVLDGMDYADAINEVFNNLNISREKKSFIIPGVESPGYGPFFLQKCDDLFPLKKINFNNMQYWGPNNNDNYLKCLFGDWEDLPKVLERHNRIYYLQKRPNFSSFLKDELLLLRKTNVIFDDY